MTDIQKIILVDPDDKQIGEIEKHRGHQFGMLHRAFSVVIFRKRNNKIETLIQQRSRSKYHGGGLWTNTCCSHPRVGEDLKMSAENRLLNEMNISVKLQPAGKFHYIAKLDNDMTENEIDHVFYGIYEEDVIEFNKDEVEDYAWVDVNTIADELKNLPTAYSPWFREALDLALKAYKENVT